MSDVMDNYGAFIPVISLLKWVLQIIQMNLTLRGDALRLAKLKIVQNVEQLSSFTLIILWIFTFSIGNDWAVFHLLYLYFLPCYLPLNFSCSEGPSHRGTNEKIWKIYTVAITRKSGARSARRTLIKVRQREASTRISNRYKKFNIESILQELVRFIFLHLVQVNSLQ